jgi:hypothetical protein
MRNRFVKVTRIKQPGTIMLLRCYSPVEMRNGNLYALCRPGDMGSYGKPHGADGFLDEDDAWAVISRIEDREAESEHSRATGR